MIWARLMLVPFWSSANENFTQGLPSCCANAGILRYSVWPLRISSMPPGMDWPPTFMVLKAASKNSGRVRISSVPAIAPDAMPDILILTDDENDVACLACWDASVMAWAGEIPEPAEPSPLGPPEEHPAARSAAAVPAAATAASFLAARPGPPVFLIG